ncbi:MAG: hypothetical protein HRU18_01330 [Pseudoalteromonas sp.]|uniref:hypothetical protein n=1 Tax=Pseudoalteromonas sp. TaxID=53249 RepID=UPI001E16F6C0|nr:hypothetical protein [Pseudoalteromonas sp.]NRA76822.1 hypothetical protein [Pseudoalteromonas sp.]
MKKCNNFPVQSENSAKIKMDVKQVVVPDTDREVKVTADETNNSQEDKDAGRMNVALEIPVKHSHYEVTLEVPEENDGGIGQGGF